MECVRILILSCFFSLWHLSLLSAQEVAPNDIPVPWYSQKVLDTPYSHNSLVAALMVIDYYKGDGVSYQRNTQQVKERIEEYQNNYFLTKESPFKKREKYSDGEYMVFEIDSLVSYYEAMQGVDYRENGDYNDLLYYINQGIPVLVNILYDESSEQLMPGNKRHWVVVRGMDDKHIWLNNPGYPNDERNKGENCRYLIKKEGEESSFDECWTGRYMVILPGEQAESKRKTKGRIPYMENPALPKGYKPHSIPKDVKADF